jgi:arylsulfatase A-like enzyme
VLVTLDTLRADALAAMPKLSARADEARVFQRAYSASSATQPTHASLFTALHPWEHGVSRNGLVLHESHVTVAERLREAGFSTAAAVASFPLHPRFGFDQGFDVFEHGFDRDLGFRRWKGARVGRTFYRTARPATEAALRQLAEAEGARQFFWFHYFDAHAPYGDVEGEGMTIGELASTRLQRPERLARSLARARRLYDRDLAHLDAQLERLFRRLDEDAARTETHVVVTADHGESFGEGNALGHGARVTPEQVRVPLLLFSPRVTPGVDVVPAGSVDVAYTLLCLAGAPTEGFGGRDLTAPGAASGATAVGLRVTELTKVDRLLAGVPERFSRRPRFFLTDGQRLYSGHADAVFEDDDPARAVSAPRARARFAAFEARLARTSATEPMDADTREGLRALGYAD